MKEPLSLNFASPRAASLTLGACVQVVYHKHEKLESSFTTASRRVMERANTWTYLV
ncbi:MAG: hypothetical protein ACK41E_12015 [Deinococcales bacterium]